MPSPLLALGAILIASEALYVALARIDAVSSAASVGVFLACMAALFALYAAAGRLVARQTPAAARSASGTRRTLAVIALGAVAFRVTLLGAGLTPDAAADGRLAAARADLTGARVVFDRYLLFDNDIWRYLWDGHVAGHGENPYRFAPLDAAVDRFAGAPAPDTDGLAIWPEVRDHVNHPAVPTIYPPLAQAAFLVAHAVAPASVLALKAVIVLADLAAVWFLALALRALGRPPELCLWYAWNPLAIKVFAGSGHADALLVAGLAACACFVARGARAGAGVAFGLAVLAKLSPIVVAPFVARRIGWRGSLAAAATVAIGYAPFLGGGTGTFAGLSVFSTVWHFNAGAYELIAWMARLLAPAAPLVPRLVAGSLLVAIVWWLARQDDGRPETFAALAAPALGALLLLSPVLMPWYVTWLLPLAVLAQQHTWLWLSALVCAAFLVMVDGQERLLPRAVEYGLLAFVGVREWRARRATGRLAPSLCTPHRSKEVVT